MLWAMKKSFKYQHRRTMNKTRKKIIAITAYLVYDSFIDLYHVVGQYGKEGVNEGNNAASDDDYVVKNSDGTLTCRAPPYTESDAPDSEADGNKDLLIIFWKSLILLVKPKFIRQMFGFCIFNIDSTV